MFAVAIFVPMGMGCRTTFTVLTLWSQNQRNKYSIFAYIGYIYIHSQSLIWTLGDDWPNLTGLDLRLRHNILLRFMLDGTCLT